MTTDDKIRNKKLQNDINRERAKISSLSSGKIDNDKYGYRKYLKKYHLLTKEVLEKKAITIEDFK